jgi:sporulation protein YlmC with PRC-barrel domain
MKRAGLFTVALVAALALATAAFAQQPAPPSSDAPAQSQPAPPPAPAPPAASTPSPASSQVMVDASSIIGSTVRNVHGQDVGRVDRLMIDPKDGRVTFAVVGMGGTMGFGSKQVTVPWSSVKVGQDQGKIIVSIDQQVLEQAPPRAQDPKSDKSPSASPATSGEQKGEQKK